jgi:HTH-type transcriptional regulator/antitoxin HigA
MLKVLKTEEEYEVALERAGLLVALDPEDETVEADELELLTLVIKTYEDEHFPMRRPTAIEAIQFRMEQQELTQRDLVPFLGSRSRVSEVLRGKRALTLKMIRALHRGLGIPADILLQEAGARLPEDVEGVEWAKFPVKEMVKRTWLKFGGSSRDVKDHAEELMRGFFSGPGACGLDHVLFRSHVRQASAMDNQALAAWCSQVMRLAAMRELDMPYASGVITSGFLRDLVKLSYLSDGPVLAKEFLEKSGIHLVLLHHLPKTHLDGAAMLQEDGTPVVALTLRHDRLDSFWFSLLHELAHVALHLSDGESPWFFDDLDVDGDALESQADEMAAKALIPEDEWKRAAVHRKSSPAAVKVFAERLRISPAIVAGRIRHERRNYRILSRLVGHGKVRELFPGLDAGVA